MSKPLWTPIVTLILAGCGGAPSGTGNAMAPVPAAASPSAFNAADACAILPRERVAAITGLQVSAAALSRVSPATGTTAGFSTCTYSFAGGGSLDLFARQSPVDDNSTAAIQQTKQAMIDTMGAKPVDVPNLGAAAFSVEQMHQLHVFIGGNRYIYFMSMSPPAGKPIAEIELALARAVAG